MTSWFEQEREKQKDLAEEKQSLQEQVESLRAELENSKISKADVQSFLQEGFFTNDKGLDAHILFFSLIRNTKQMHLDLLRNAELLNQ